MADAWQELAGVQKEMDVGNVTSGDLFGTREYLRNNYLHRILGAVWGIYGKFQGGSDLSNEAVLQGRCAVDAQVNESFTVGLENEQRRLFGFARDAAPGVVWSTRSVIRLPRSGDVHRRYG